MPARPEPALWQRTAAAMRSSPPAGLHDHRHRPCPANPAALPPAATRRDEHYGFQLYQSDPSGNYGGWKAVAIGAGHQAANNQLKTDFKDDITMAVRGAGRGAGGLGWVGAVLGWGCRVGAVLCWGCGLQAAQPG